ncbi:MAG: FtsH protease activity modulator HflK [Phycisphaerae bacterium]|nr:FtsH protease activity modulator HflK [Phycisphaerae bacterium]
MAHTFNVRRINSPQQINPIVIWRIIRWAVIAVLVVYGVMTSLYTIETNSAGVVKRFGKYNRITEPGIHLKLPFGIEKAIGVPVKSVQKEEFGFRTVKAGVDSQYLGIDEIQSGRYSREALVNLIRESGESRSSSGNLQSFAKELLQREYIMLTGDLNIVDVEWIVQYKIKNPRQYLFNVRNARQTIRDCSQAVMRQLVGNGSVDEAITIGRTEYEKSGEKMLQQLLDNYETGIHIVTVKMQSSNPPQRVRPAFNEVNKALQQKEQRINEAMKQYNEVVPKTRGQAQRVIEAAKGYAAERVNEAQGDVNKFEKILTEYQKAPTITRQRLYLETMGKVLPQIPEKWIIEQGGADGGILMKLDLDNVTPSK